VQQLGCSAKMRGVIVNQKSAKPIGQALLAAALFGASAPLSKLLLSSIEPVALASLLYLGSGLCSLALLGIQRLEDRGSPAEAGLRRSDLPWLLGALLTGGVAAPIILLVSLRNTPAATASLLLNFEGVATTLIAALAFRESVGRRVWWAVGLVTVGSMLLSWEGDGGWGLSVGALGVLAACVLWGVDNNVTRVISAKNPLVIVAVKGLGAGTVNLILAGILGQKIPPLGMTLGALALGAMSYGVGIQLFVLALRGLGAARTIALYGTAPFIGLVIAFALFGGVPDLRLLSALVLMALGVYLLVGESHAHEHVHSAIFHEHRHSHGDDHHRHAHDFDVAQPERYHSHDHRHNDIVHEHPHAPDLHHDHRHNTPDAAG
jgi:drug/metabolite transporter (DMT)-like permease